MLNLYVAFIFTERTMIGFQRCLNTKLRLIVLKSTLFNSEFGCWRWISSDAMGSYSCRVIVSRVPCIYSNLALEDWLYERTGTDVSQRFLLMWRSSPCVVIGKFQNQWQECNYGELSKHGIKLGKLFTLILCTSITQCQLNMSCSCSIVKRNK